MSPPKLFFVVTEDSYFLSHRLPMARAARRAGFDVSVVTNVTAHRAAIEQENIRVIPFSFDRRSLNPLRAIAQAARLCALYRREKPALVHNIAMKPVLIGSLSAWLSGVPHVINAFAGLGYLFAARSPQARALRLAVIPMFRLLLKRPGFHLLLQNNDDLVVLRGLGMVPEGRISIIRGSGVDIGNFTQQAFIPPAPEFICVFAGRMIGIKGLQTLRDAFAILRKRVPQARLWLCGAPDPANPGAWTEAQIKEWSSASGNVIYKGHCREMGTVWARAHVAVQPSWGGEGVPKALLEAASCGRALVASDVPGCREVVHDGKNGLLVPPRDAALLAQAIEILAGDPGLCRRMGEESRRLIERSDLTADAVATRTEELYRQFL